MTSVPVENKSSASGPRPVNLRTDLAHLADLMELVFADSMDQGGRAAVREMRYLSKIGVGISLLPGLNDLTHGINMGYVWIEDGKLIGNVSIYPTNRPVRNTWIIANVGVHPDYQRRGIATQLMRTSMETVRARGGEHAILQVDTDNETARRLYERLGFIDERSWILWRRSSTLRIPPPMTEQSVRVSHRRRGEWRSEYELAQLVRPADHGGLGWQRPLDISLFRKPLLKQVGDWLNMRSEERLVIRSEDEQRILASLWVEGGMLTTATQLTLLIDPAYQGVYDEVLMNTAVRRFTGRNTALVVEHPADETQTGDVLRGYQFRAQRHVTHMRWDVK
ncbi:MAG: GNAT family N-acetyltransferase [Anaerolineae bacterium]|nr:GNAT family N-acetyltransferase [Anaerolineae bacterium]